MARFLLYCESNEVTSMMINWDFWDGPMDQLFDQISKVILDALKSVSRVDAQLVSDYFNNSDIGRFTQDGGATRILCRGRRSR